MGYYSQPGTDECKKKYKDIECRRRFPYCDPSSGTTTMKIEECKKVGECVPCKAVGLFSVLRMEAVNEGGTARGVAFGAALQCACTAVCQPLLKSVQCGLVVSITN